MYVILIVNRTNHPFVLNINNYEMRYTHTYLCKYLHADMHADRCYDYLFAMKNALVEVSWILGEAWITCKISMQKVDLISCALWV